MRSKTGTVISAKQEKTIVIRVDRYVSHPKYHKRYRVSKKFHAHDEEGKAKEGDTVTITETTPISKLKCWKVTEIQSTNPAKPVKTKSVGNEDLHSEKKVEVKAEESTPKAIKKPK